MLIGLNFKSRELGSGFARVFHDLGVMASIDYYTVDPFGVLQGSPS